MSVVSFFRRGVVSLAFLGVVAEASAQCTNQWAGSWATSATELDDVVLAATTTATNDIVMGGAFTQAGTLPVGRIARWNGTAWSSLAGGMNGTVRALLTLPNGDIVAGGQFTTAGGVPAGSIARFNGTSWSAMGSGFAAGSSVASLALMPNGDIVAGGFLPGFGGIAVFNGTSWLRTNGANPSSAVAPGVNGEVLAMAVLPTTGQLVFGGTFNSVFNPGVPGSTALFVGLWNGGTSPLSPLNTGSGVCGTNGQVRAIAVRPNAGLVMGGDFTQVSNGGAPFGAAGVVSWSSLFNTTLSPGLSGVPATALGNVHALAVDPSGFVYAGGNFTSSGGTAVNNLAVFNGSWTAQAGGMGGIVNPTVFALTVSPTRDIVAGGSFLEAGTTTTSPTSSRRVARFGCVAAAPGYGAGCPAVVGGASVAFTATNSPVLGTTFNAVGSAIPANSVVLSLLGLTAISVPLNTVPLPGTPMPGCLLLSSGEVVGTLVPTGSTVAFALPVPFTPSLVGQSLFAQLSPWEFLPGGAVQISSSNGLQLNFGAF